MVIVKTSISINLLHRKIRDHKMLRLPEIRTSGGKGNAGMFIERDRKICAAGLPILDRNTVANILPCYILQDHADALLSDAIFPESKAYFKEPTKIKRDMRNAGFFSEGAELINPPVKTKFQTLVQDFKNTVYHSYWRKEVGRIPDPKGNLPEGMNIYTTTMGAKYPNRENAYDVMFPKNPVKGQTPINKECGFRTTRNYCSFNPDKTFGIRTNADSSSKQMKCLLTDDRVPEGKHLKQPICSNHARFMDKHRSRLRFASAPNDNITCVPNGFAFGKVEALDGTGVPNCLTSCEINPDRSLFLKCLEHLNSLRKCLSKRFGGTFFHKFILELKYMDKLGSGWLPKNIIYDICKSKHIRFNSNLVEPLLIMWNILDGSQIQYKPFVGIINFTLPIPELQKVPDITDDCLDFRTTYSEMTKDALKSDTNKMAGIPSGRYFDKDYPITPDNCCRAHRFYLPEESDAKSCLNPSILTLMGISHRDMYAKRSKEIIRKVFEKAGEIFTDDSFDEIWNIAETYHSNQWVCYETFRRALTEYKNKPK